MVFPGREKKPIVKAILFNNMNNSFETEHFLGIFFMGIINRYFKSGASWHVVPCFPFQFLQLHGSCAPFPMLIRSSYTAWLLYIFFFENDLIFLFFVILARLPILFSISPLIAPFIMLVWNNLIPEVDVGKFQKFFKVQLLSSLISINQEDFRIFLWTFF